TTIPTYQFLTKLWAKKKMDNLYILYHTFDPESPEAEEIENMIIDISICYNVISPFTSYTGGGTVFIEDPFEEEAAYGDKLCYAYPNPFTSEINIHFIVNEPAYETATLRIFDSFGRLIDVVAVQLNGKGEYQILWNGTNLEGIPVPSGYYFYTIQYNKQILKGNMIKL
ncbi:MAG: hypothetical protein DRI87_05515, partial [Bacteroidetes bacterium]